MSWGLEDERFARFINTILDLPEVKNLVGKKEPLSHSEIEAIIDQIKTISKEAVNDPDLNPF